MIRLNISDFPPSHNHINGTDDMVVNKFDIARAGMVIGYPKLSIAIFSLGVFRFLELYFRTETYLEKSNNFYQLKPIFHLIDSSEQKAISYFFGQAFAKLFAEKYLNCDQVDNFGNHKGNVTFNNNGKKFVPKHNLYNSTKNPKEPDLIGFSNGGLHILEAKGYSSGFKGSEFQHAINQVSIVDKVNGIKPITKTACFFDLSGNPIIGTVKDPDSPNSSIDINFDKEAFIFNYYQLFNLKKLNRKTYWEVKIGDNKFAGFRLFNTMYPRYFWGVDIDIFEQINNGEKLEFKKKFYKYENENMSIGPDGIIFMETNIREYEIERKYWA
jgi:hypothetical protein